VIYDRSNGVSLASLLNLRRERVDKFHGFDLLPPFIAVKSKLPNYQTDASLFYYCLEEQSALLLALGGNKPDYRLRAIDKCVH
jgi:hypothetical protein